MANEPKKTELSDEDLDHVSGGALGTDRAPRARPTRTSQFAGLQSRLTPRRSSRGSRSRLSQGRSDTNAARPW